MMTTIIIIQKCKICGKLFASLPECPHGCKKGHSNIYGEWDVQVFVPDGIHCIFDCQVCNRDPETGECFNSTFIREMIGTMQSDSVARKRKGDEYGKRK